MEFWSVDFWEEEENGVVLPASKKKSKTSQSKGQNQQQPPPIYGVDSGIWTRATLMGGEWFHHSATLRSIRSH